MTSSAAGGHVWGLKYDAVEVISGYSLKGTYFFILASGGRLTHRFIKKNVKVANK